MPAWTCPNMECQFDKQLQPGQRCPLCGKDAQGFGFKEFGDLLKKKGGLRKVAERIKEGKNLLHKLKFCPKCGSPKINFLIFYCPSLWKCSECGYEGAFVIEDGGFADRIKAGRRKASKKNASEEAVE